MEFYTLSAEKTIEKLGSSIKNGLSSDEVNIRYQKYGRNILPHEKPIPIWKIFLSQLLDPMIVILLIAAALTLVIKHYQDFYIIGAIVIIEFVIGFIEEYRSEKIVEELIKISKSRTKVIRDGKLINISSENLVPGDIIQLNSGDKVPADARIISTDFVTVNESVLTGESALLEKNTDIVDIDTPITSRINTVYQGSYIANGGCIAIVTSIGSQTEFGRITLNVQKISRTKTPLQKKLAGFTNIVAIVVIIAAIVFSIVGIVLGKDIYEIFLLAVSLSVAAIPESFPIIVAIALVTGIARLAKKKVIVKHLPAVETLGSTSIICMDKTGTITENRLSTKKILMADGLVFNIDKLDYSPEGNFLFENEADKVIKPINFPHLEMLLIAGTVCNDSSIKKNNLNEWMPVGDPTEAALISASAKGDLDPDFVNQDFTRQSTIPFQSGQNYMATLNYSESRQKRYIFIKGSPETIINKCSYQAKVDSAVKFGVAEKKELLQKAEQLANKSYRIMAVGYKEAPIQGEYLLNETNLKYGLIFLGFVAMTDPIRPDAIESYGLAKKAGLKVIIITGDHPTTTANIAKSMGMKVSDNNILTGEQLNLLTQTEFEKIAHDISIYARVLPDQKLRIIQFWQQKGEVVAMTGDGVNDALALKKADIGIAMGNGTDVAKEAAEIILVENNFSRIIETIKQGRTIYDNIRKSVIYLLGHNLGELGIIFLSLIFRLPIPLLPTQILWMNLVTDGLIDESLVFEKPEPDIMNKSPRSPQERFLNNLMARRIAVIGIYMSLVSFAYYIYIQKIYNLEYARTVIFVMMGFFSIFGIYACRSLKFSFWKSRITDNILLLYTIVISVILQLSVVYIPYFNDLFHTLPLSLYDLMLTILIALTLLFVIELHKYLENIFSSTKKILSK